VTPAIEPTLVVAEVFGPTFQGEGPSAGRLASFIRLGGCNLHCPPCDSKFTWDASRFDLRKEMTRRPVDDVARQALGYGARLIVISGGEPLLHQAQPGWAPLLARLRAARCEVEVETNGTMVPNDATTALVTRFNVSPKLRAMDGDPESARIVPAAIAALWATRRAVFKFVCSSPADVDEAAATTKRLGIYPHKVWIMPEGTTAEKITASLRVLADPAREAGFNLTTRLHVLAWGDERGR